MKQRVIVLGSTGSVGRNTLEVIQGLGEGWEIVGLAAGSRCEELAEQANRFRPPAIAIARPDCGKRLGETLTYGPEIFCGDDALVRLIESVSCDCVVMAVVGAEGLAATVRAVELGIPRVALANKEALVIAGAILIPLARRSGTTLLPIDSEHSAIFQAMHAGRRADVRKIYLTASGGPFRTWSAEAMSDITLEDALRHPTWSMGPKITIDSATLMNKALEIIEARWFFDLAPEDIEVVIHPESIIHSMVEFCDGSVVAQMGPPDMRIPIQYALTYPERRVAAWSPFDVCAVGRLTFHRPDAERFPALRLGHQVAQQGGTAGAVFNAANEAAVQLFRDKALGFRDIAAYTERVLQGHRFIQNPSLDELLAADLQARQEVMRCLSC